ncbi:hypothetical protein SAMN05444369_10667 [Capnocytophaga haemolytica]|jgi:hypothetical protein|uniref:Uncharacterized protein n=1 Tax=Capnocytophaga haemolytica TaxID=45243 RepID=A0AAX2GYE7_9FLAO|nr:hypothetical protein [Capnocytophaga haemolytica]AMD84569.1 hypothetical protein AXF12_02945 [Capnocytophaga haemolytica]SFN99503.1 hypothetical protein SAMN05444369_10667 [Capnocytophaga haemolytica]SNV09238.1 Uncharacterised protein [Capnocytophaga haemolytica]
MVTTLEFKQPISIKQLLVVEKLLDAIGIEIKKDDTELSEKEFFAKINRAKNSKRMTLTEEKQRELFSM